MKPSIILILFLFFTNREKAHTRAVQDPIEKDFKTWNEKTIESVKTQLIRANNSQVKSTLQNRLDVLQSSLYSATTNESGISGTGKALRYKFLKVIRADRQNSKNAFIIESESEGEVLQLRNYLIQNIENSSHITVYSYFKNNWTKVRDTIISKIDLHSELQSNSTDINKITGANPSDLIISEFNASTILSRYYIPLSIEKGNIIQRVLKL